MKLRTTFPLLGLLAAASYAHADPDPDLGSSVQAIERAEIINRHPVYRGDPAPGSDGTKAVRAITRFRLDREKLIIIPSTDPQTGRPGTPVNGSGELQNGTQILAGDSASGQGSTGREATGGGESTGSASSSSKSSSGGPSSR